MTESRSTELHTTDPDHAASGRADSAESVAVSPSSRTTTLANGAAIGAATAVGALGAATLTAGFRRDFSSPVTLVGDRVIDAVPPWLKTFAIEQFGTKDKPILVGTVLFLLLLFAIVLGIISRRHRSTAVAGAGLFGFLGVLAALGGNGGIVSTVPSIVGGVVAMVIIYVLASRAWTNGSAEVDAVTEVAATPSNATSAVTPAVAPAAETFSEGAASIEADSLNLDSDLDLESPTVHRATGESSDRVSAVLGPVGRRAFLGSAGIVAAGGAVAAASGRWLRSRFDAAKDRANVLLPKAKSPVPPLDTAPMSAGVDGATPFITPNSEFYRVDTALAVPQVDIESWELTIDGMVDKPLTFTFDDLLSRDLVEADVTLTCVSNEVGGRLAGTARWLGVPLRELLEEAGVSSGADQIVGRSVDDYTCGFPTSALDDDRTAMVVVGMNGEPLPVNHGFPARLLVAGLYGYVSATKWLKQIEITRFDTFDQYWVPRGWDAQGPIKTLSRIDTPAALSKISAGRHPVAGVAWAQTRGIDAVEVRMDDGPWLEAELKTVPNDETWRQWVLPMDFEPGSHNLTCRATDSNGDVQTEERAAPRPNGASGWHSVVTLVSE